LYIKTNNSTLKTAKAIVTNFLKKIHKHLFKSFKIKTVAYNIHIIQMQINSINSPNPDNVSSVKTLILNDRFILIKYRAYRDDQNTPQINQYGVSMEDNYIKTNFSELIYSKINQTVNDILKKKHIIKMPILHHSSVFFIKEYTESPISNAVLFRNPIYNIKMIYDSTNNTLPIYARFSSNEFDIQKCTKEMISNTKIVHPELITHMFKKTKEIIKILNDKLSSSNIMIHSSSLEYCCKLGAKTGGMIYINEPERVIENVFLKPIINVFDNFTFTEIMPPPSTVNEPVPITDIIKIYKAFTMKESIDIEIYKSEGDVIEEFKQIYKI